MLPADWSAKDALLLALGIVTAIYLYILGTALVRARAAAMADASPSPTLAGIATGFFANFWDTL